VSGSRARGGHGETPRRGYVEDSIPGGYQLDALQRGWRFQRAWHRSRLELVQYLLPPTGDGLVLDAAAGSGIVTWRFRNHRIVSTDMRVSACAAIRRHTPGARSLAALLDALPFRSGTFSRIYLLEAIEHLDTSAGAHALRELHRVARPGATCLVSTPNYRSCWPVLEWILDRVGPTPPMAEGQHLSRYDRRTLTRAAEDAGWTVGRIGSFNLVSPMAGTVSAAAGAWALRVEADRLPAGGPLLFALLHRGR